MLKHEIHQYCLALSYSPTWLTSVAQMYITSRDNSSAPDELKRSKLDRRRLLSAHFKYAILQVASWYPGDLSVSDIVFSTDVYQTLLDFTPRFQNVFHRKYSGTSLLCIVVHVWECMLDKPCLQLALSPGLPRGLEPCPQAPWKVWGWGWPPRAIYEKVTPA